MKADYSFPTCSEFLATEFDYLIVDGGTSGLVLANRLSENPNVVVGVIEAGKAKLDDGNVLSPTGISAMLHNSEYDWKFKTIPQAGNRDEVHHLPRGKLLGSSSAVNFMAYVRPSASDIDSWGEENAGWSWNDLEPYYLKHEDLQHLLNSTKNLVHLSSASHGQGGPLRLSMPPSPVPFEQSLFTGLEHTSGIPRPDDPYGGQNLGAFESLSNIDRTGGQVRRSYSASAYLIPALERPNLKVLTEASYKVKASQEIILSASTIQTPRILELSGIGNRAILLSAGIDPIVDLPAVGENLQEHPMTAAVYELVPDIGSFPTPQVPKTALEATVAAVEAPEKGDKFRESYRKQIVSSLRDADFATIQYYGIPGHFNLSNGHSNQGLLLPGAPAGRNACYTMLISAMYPASRGSTHISPRGSLHGPPDIDLGILTHQADVDVLAAGLAFVDKVFSSKDVAGSVRGRVDPPPAVNLQVPAEAQQFARERIMPFNHILGTCAMGPVVDNRLRVKSVEGLRVVDASVFPSQISGNIISTVYAIAEKAADMIKEDGPKFR
ncbi:CAZyme family AA3 [Penicillium psychrosexuale]|uniref:CAZyme family AA3 n=1 Tax=Penicillium psychrosexuale TaxID=1002107 RepID=UPI0025451BD4|nr:CAZyme family AA3 [Penicillium psychrosexuale]KAJ5800631.1 CAZyme family AA3 [Penicillium psychrosexuale]